MYPEINKFVKLLHAKNISSFLVTNAQFPDAIRYWINVSNLHTIQLDALVNLYLELLQSHVTRHAVVCQVMIYLNNLSLIILIYPHTFPIGIYIIIPTLCSVDAATKESLKKIDRPLFKDFWERFLDSLKEIKDKVNI